jgi:hypothetical protein
MVHRFEPPEPNVFRFEAIEAQYVRVDILPGSKGQPCIDAFEIFAPGSETNLTLAGKATASSLLPGCAYKHPTAFLNDGVYGNGRSWIQAKLTAWAQIKLVERSKTDRVLLSRDREGKLRARLLTSFDILVSNDGKACAEGTNHQEYHDGINGLPPHCLKALGRYSELVEVGISNSHQTQGWSDRQPSAFSFSSFWFFGPQSLLASRSLIGLAVL